MTEMRSKPRIPNINTNPELESKLPPATPERKLTVISKAPAADSPFLEFLKACNFQTPKCEKCEKKARFLVVYAEQEDERYPAIGNIEFYRVCLDHLTPDIGCDDDRTGSSEVIDLENKVEFTTFSSDEIRAVKMSYETRMDYRIAFTELLKFAKMSIDHDQKTSTHHEHVKQRSDMLAECKIDESECKTWPHYYPTLTKLFRCCGWKDEECWRLGCGRLADEANKYFSKYCIELYERFYRWCIARDVLDCSKIIEAMFLNIRYWSGRERDLLPEVVVPAIVIDHNEIAVKELKKYTELCIENDRKYNEELFKICSNALERKIASKELDTLNIKIMDDLKQEYDKHLKHIEIRTKTFQECKDDIKTLFYCCSSEVYDEKSGYMIPQSMISCIISDCWFAPCKKCWSQMFEIFSPDSISIYREFYEKQLQPHIDDLDDHKIWKSLGKYAVCVRVIEDIFGRKWFNDFQRKAYSPKPIDTIYSPEETIKGYLQAAIELGIKLENHFIFTKNFRS